MKKLFLSLIALVIGFSAYATDYYLIGGFNNWSLKQANCKFTDQNDGTFVLDYKGTLTSGFKINDGTWSNDAANFGGSATLQLGVVYNLTAGGSSQNIPLSSNISNPHLVLNPTAKTLLITGENKESVTIYGIHGDIFGDSNWSTENMTDQNGKWVLSNKTINAGSFGIKAMDKDSGSQTSWISADGSAAVVVDQTMKCKVEGTNFVIAAGTYTFTFDPDAMTLVVTGTSTGETPGVNEYASWWVNVMGSFTGGDDVNSAPSAQPNAEGLVSFTNLALGTSQIEIKTWDGSTDAYYSNGSTPIPVGSWVQLSDAQGVRSTIANAASNSVYNIDYNVATNEIKITLVSGDTPIDPTPGETTFYLVGGFSDWVANEDYAFSDDGDGIYTLSLPSLSGEFKIFDGDWESINLGGDAQGADVTSVNAVIGTNTLYAGSSVNLVAGAGWTNVVLTLNYEGGNYATLEIEADVPTIDPDATVIYIVGTGDGLTWTLPGKAFTGENGIVTFDINNVSSFKMAPVMTTNWDEYNAAALFTTEKFTDEVYPNGQTLSVATNENAAALNQELPWAGDYTFTLDLNNKTLKAVAKTTQKTEGLEIYIRGDFTGENWAANPTWKFKYNEANKNYTFECKGDTKIEANQEFKFADATWGSVNYGYSSAITPTEEGETIELASPGNNMSFTTDFEGTITIKFENNKPMATFVLDLGGTNGVSGIEAENGSVEYYNLQGVRVANPERGIFIRVENGKASKVVK